jgi:hypothetical protein
MAGHQVKFDDGRTMFVDYADAEGSAVVNGRTWRWEFHEWGGPLWLRRDGEPRKNQCPHSKAVWDAFEQWHQGYKRNKPLNASIPPDQSAYLNLGTARTDIAAAQRAWLDQDHREAIVWIRNAIAQLRAAEAKLTNLPETQKTVVRPANPGLQPPVRTAPGKLSPGSNAQVNHPEQPGPAEAVAGKL